MGEDIEFNDSILARNPSRKEKITNLYGEYLQKEAELQEMHLPKKSPKSRVRQQISDEYEDLKTVIEERRLMEKEQLETKYR